MKRLYSLDFIKLVFAYVIAFFHFGHELPPGPTVTVQLFFFISGFFLARKYYARSHSDGGKQYDQWNYTMDHVKQLYPHYVFAYAILFLYHAARAGKAFLLAPSWEPIQQTLTNLYDQAANLLFMQSAYHFHDNMNYPLWQLSALVISGYFVYSLLCHNERLSRSILFPASILMLLSLQGSGVDLFGHYGFIYMPLLRAFSGLGYGVLLYCFSNCSYCVALKEKKILFNIAVILSLVCLFIFAEHNSIHYITCALLILGCAEESSWLNKVLNRPIFRYCGNLSYSIYLNHALACRFTNNAAVYFVVLTLYSAAAFWLVEHFMSHIHSKKAAAV